MANAYRPAPERFWEKVQKTEGCWFWIGYLHPYGYGQFSNGGRLVPAHRWSYEDAKGAVPEGMQLDHLCRTRACVRPDHLEAVTSRENTVRGFLARGLDWACRRGHTRTPENTHIRPNGDRYCRECKRERDRMKVAA
jgi:hypothetical protein